MRQSNFFIVHAKNIPASKKYDTLPKTDNAPYGLMQYRYWMYFYLSRGIRLAAFILFSSQIRLSEILPLRYFSIISDTIGAAQVAPNPAFSTTIAIAIFGLSFGANAMKMEWLPPCGFSAVPVLPHTIILSIRAIRAVEPLPPPFTAHCIPCIMGAKYCESTLVRMTLVYAVSSGKPSIFFIICGRIQ